MVYFMAKQKHYINNEDFLKALVDYKAACKLAKKEKQTPPAIPNYIGECFMKIAEGLSHKPNFINYTYRDEMMSDGIENCLTAVEKFDPERGMNPFAYFTQITFFAFVRRIQKEKKQMATKFRYIDQLDINDLVTQEHDNGEFQNQFLEFLKTQMDQYEYEKVVSTITKKTEKILKDIDTDTEE
jgi:hypothetical protein